MKIERLTERHFDELLDKCGGERFSEDSSKETSKNADYKLNDTLIELKLIDEEGLEKQTRQERIAKLFKKLPDTEPVVVLDPDSMDSSTRRSYLRILEGPIKTAVKKASKQLQSSEQTCGFKVNSRVLLIANVGYMAVRRNRFKEIVRKCVLNDTRAIDHVIVTGIYYDGDGFESYITSSLDEFNLNAARPFNIKTLGDEWGQMVETLVSITLKQLNHLGPMREKINDISFEVDGRTFVRPRPKMGKPSKFFVQGRPRINSTGIDTCPPIAQIYPKLTEDQWIYFRKTLIDQNSLKSSYSNWLSYTQEISAEGTPLQPTVSFPLHSSDFESHELKKVWFCDLVERATDNFTNSIRIMVEQTRERPKTLHLPTSYILITTTEIGVDKAWDCSSIELISETPGFERRKTLLAKQKLFFEYGLALAHSYAMKHGVENVFYEKDLTYAWV